MSGSLDSGVGGEGRMTTARVKYRVASVMMFTGVQDGTIP
jgi:hypothetical protein